MRLKKPLVILIVLMMPVFLFATGNQDREGASADNVPEIRVVSLAPNITEIIYVLGRGNLLAGRTDYCNYPPEAAGVPSVGSIMEPSVETIIQLHPDIVLASTHAPEQAAELLEQAGIPVKMYYGPESFEGAYKVIQSVGAELGAVAEAEALVKDMRSRYENLKNKAANLKSRPSVYYAIGFGEGGDWTAGGDTFINQMIETAGGDNIAADTVGWSYSLEKLFEKQPEIILVGEDLRETFINTPIYSKLEAVKNGRVYGINEDIIDRQGPRLMEGLEQLYEIFSE